MQGMIITQQRFKGYLMDSTSASIPFVSDHKGFLQSALQQQEVVKKLLRSKYRIQCRENRRRQRKH
jgi:hypothetical protein